MSADGAVKTALATWVDHHHPGGRLSDVTILKGGISAQMTRYTVLVPNAAPITYVLRSIMHPPGGNAEAAVLREQSLLNWLHTVGQPAPKVMDVDLAGARFGTPSLVLGFLDGAPQFSPHDPIAFANTFACGLAQVHRLGLPPPSDVMLPRQTETYAAPLAKLRLQLGSPMEKNPQTLLHGDYWPGNVVWQGDDITGVIDWEEAAIGDPLADLAISRLDILWLLGPDAMTAMTARYVRETRIDLTDLALWDLIAATRPGNALDQWSQTYPAVGRPDITTSLMADRMAWFIDQALMGHER